jgi:hypothetical protein
MGQKKLFIKSPFELFQLDQEVEKAKHRMANLIQNKYRNFKNIKVQVESDNLSIALEKTYGDTEKPIHKQLVNQINQKGQRKRMLLVVTTNGTYLLEPKSYTVMKKIDYKKMDKFLVSNLPGIKLLILDGVFVLKTEKDQDIVIESDNKQFTMKPIRDAFEESNKEQQKQLLIEVKDEVEYSPKKGETSKIKFRKGEQEKTTIEVDEEGLIVSIKPINDIFQGAKLRRQASYR